MGGCPNKSPKDSTYTKLVTTTAFSLNRIKSITAMKLNVNRNPHTRQLTIALLLFLPQALAFPLPVSLDLHRRLSITTPSILISNLDLPITADNFNPTTALPTTINPERPKTTILATHSITTDDTPIPSNNNMFLSSSSTSPFQQPQPQSGISPPSLLTTLQTLLIRLQHNFNLLHLPLPLAFLVSFTLSFLFVLSSVFTVFLLWHGARRWVGFRGRMEGRGRRGRMGRMGKRTEMKRRDRDRNASRGWEGYMIRAKKDGAEMEDMPNTATPISTTRIMSRERTLHLGTPPSALTYLSNSRTSLASSMRSSILASSEEEGTPCPKSGKNNSERKKVRWVDG
jgi:hypothetical protein